MRDSDSFKSTYDDEAYKMGETPIQSQNYPNPISQDHSYLESTLPKRSLNVLTTPW